MQGLFLHRSPALLAHHMACCWMLGVHRCLQTSMQLRCVNTHAEVAPMRSSVCPSETMWGSGWRYTELTGGQCGVQALHGQEANLRAGLAAVETRALSAAMRALKPTMHSCKCQQGAVAHGQSGPKPDGEAQSHPPVSAGPSMAPLPLHVMSPCLHRAIPRRHKGG